MRDMVLNTNNAEDVLHEKINDQILREALLQLSAQQRQIYLLSREQGLRRQEIATLLNISENTVKTHMSKALRVITAFIRKRELRTVLWVLAFEKYFL